VFRLRYNEVIPNSLIQVLLRRKTMFNKILVGSDGSEYARNAALAGAAIARHFGSEVLALNVFDCSFATTGDLGAWAVAIDQDTIDLCIQKERDVAERVIKPIFEQRGVGYKMLQEFGHPVDGILNVANRQQVELIVVGSRGLTGLKELFLGSVSHGVLHHAHCPVLIAGGESKGYGAEGFQHILLVSDGSESAQKAATTAVHLAQKFATSLMVLNVVEPLPSLIASHNDRSDPLTDLTPDIYARQLLDRVRKPVQCATDETEVSCSFRQERGRPEETIVRFAQEQGSDLIVMGSRGLGGFKRLLLGSVSNYVTHHAHCPVLVVR
jgi:nucleotide-binding universal stress UspA family protein